MDERCFSLEPAAVGCLPSPLQFSLPWISILHTAVLNYTQYVIRFTSFTGLSTRWVTCRANTPFTCFTFRNHSKHAFYLLRLCSFFLPANFMSHDRQVGVNVTHRKPLPRPRLSWAAQQPSLPASPCHTKEKRWRTSANSCQSCHALCCRRALDKQLVEIPTETCRPAPPAPPPFLYHHYLLILYADLFHFNIFSSLPFLFKTLLRAQDRSLITLNCLKIQLKAMRIEVLTVM